MSRRTACPCGGDAYSSLGVAKTYHFLELDPPNYTVPIWQRGVEVCLPRCVCVSVCVATLAMAQGLLYP
jgi:hypothetical protein